MATTDAAGDSAGSRGARTGRTLGRGTVVLSTVAVLLGLLAGLQSGSPDERSAPAGDGVVAVSPAGQAAPSKSSSPARSTRGSGGGQGPDKEPSPGAPSSTAPSTPGTVPATVTTTLRETGAYLANPGTGYQGWSHAVAMLPQSTEYRRGEHPDQGGFDWATLNPWEGVYDWAPIDDFLAGCAARGQQGSFRVFTMNGAPYGTNRVPAWVQSRGAIIRPTVDLEPDYRSREYQEYWGRFVDALAERYDGDPRIAFIDISGYGRFNEWQANEFTDTTDQAGLGTSVDASTRRHLIHMFVGGAGTARVIERDGISDGTLAYAHPGFSRTQLVMPYGGLWSSSRFVAANHPHVGLRSDALFSPHADLADFEAMGFGVTDVWKSAPVVFEAVGPPTASSLGPAGETLRGMGASLFHENAVMTDRDALTALVRPLGYRYHPSRVSSPSAVPRTGSMTVEVAWTNTGTARAYPRMGQDFVLSYGLADSSGAVVASWTADHGVSGWLPGEQRIVRDSLPLLDLASGTHTVLIGVADRDTGQRIALPLADTHGEGWYRITTVQVTG